MYEARHHRPLPLAVFRLRLLRHLGAAMLLLGLSLGLGMLGYAGLEQLSALDAFLNAAMLLGGMGPVHLPQTAGGKLFAGLYALYAGLVFIAVAALMLTPVAHRLLHRFHWDADERA